MGLGLWHLTPLSTISQIYHGDQIYWQRKPMCLEKTTNLSHIVRWAKGLEYNVKKSLLIIWITHFRFTVYHYRQRSNSL